MDINTINATVNNSIVQFEGTAYELLIELRQRAVGELKILLERELLLGLNDNQQSYYIFDDEERELSFQSTDEIIYNITNEESEEIKAIDSGNDSLEQSLSEQLDTDIVTKIRNISSFLEFSDKIIKVKGEHDTSSSSPVDDIINQFKKIDSVKENYGEFVISTGFKTL